MLKFGFALESNKSRKTASSSIPMLSVLGGTVQGKFRLNEAGSMLLGIAPGEHIGIISNAGEIRKAINEKNPDLIAWAEANKCSVEDYPVSFAIVKGYNVLNPDGTKKQVKVTLTKELEAQLLEEGKVDEEGKVIVPTVDEFTGSRTSSNSKFATVGSILEFNDGGTWGKLRTDIVIEKGERVSATEDQHVIFKIDKANAQNEMLPNGSDEGLTEVIAYPLVFSKITDVVKRNQKAAESAESAEAADSEDESSDNETTNTAASPTPAPGSIEDTFSDDDDEDTFSDDDDEDVFGDDEEYDE